MRNKARLGPIGGHDQCHGDKREQHGKEYDLKDLVTSAQAFDQNVVTGKHNKAHQGKKDAGDGATHGGGTIRHSGRPSKGAEQGY